MKIENAADYRSIRTLIALANDKYEADEPPTEIREAVMHLTSQVSKWECDAGRQIAELKARLGVDE